jgi:collagenase-like PrtC family protease
MRLFSVPADFKTETIDRYAELNARYHDARVEETYGQASVGAIFGSGRSAASLPPVDLKKLASYIEYSAERRIGFNYTFNPSCLGNTEFSGAGLAKINRFLDKLWKVGVRNLTVSLPQLVAIVQDSSYSFAIKGSTMGLVNSAVKAAHHKSIGISRIVIDEDITRDFRRIRLIRAAFGEGVEMIVNSSCLKDCPYKTFHWNYESHASYAREDVKRFYSHRCLMRKTSDWQSPLKLNCVRPEDLHYYEKCGISRFKIQGRNSAAHGDPARAAEAYMKGSYSGNLYDLTYLFDSRLDSMPYHPYMDNEKLEGFLTPFYTNPNHCSGNCESCGYCEGFAEASIGQERSAEMLRKAQASIADRDPFQVYRAQSKTITLSRRLGRKIAGAVRGRH